jgi:hypothetical protein
LKKPPYLARDAAGFDIPPENTSEKHVEHPSLAKVISVYSLQAERVALDGDKIQLIRAGTGKMILNHFFDPFVVPTVRVGKTADRFIQEILNG